jgi:hypothetical protein
MGRKAAIMIGRPRAELERLGALALTDPAGRGSFDGE